MSRVLIIDDEESICWGLTQLCQQLGYESVSESSAELGLQRAGDERFDAIVMDVRLPGMDGITAIEHFHQTLGAVPIIIMTAFGDLQTAIQAVQQGAFEYIVKPFSLDAMRSRIQQAIATRRLTENRSAESPTGLPPTDASGLIGSSPLIQEVYKQIALATTTEAPVLISGESGTGKELTARSIHQFGPRADGPFVAVNIASLSPSLAESELFGHVKGAFTGADAARTGLIQQAHSGTLFLDEVAEIPIEIQVKLLRVLDLGEVTPVGSNTPVKTNFRLISATHQDLLSQVNHGEFRHDLLYRLKTFEIQLPPLRQRREDIPELVQFFLGQRGTPAPAVAESFIESLGQRHWPGNVRELQNVVDRAATLARGGILTAEQVAPEESLAAPGQRGDAEDALRQLVADWTQQHWDDPQLEALYEALLQLIEPAIFATAFELCQQQYSAAARRLGIHRTTLKKKLDEAQQEDDLPDE